MFVKIINFRRIEPRKKTDLTRLLLYLFKVKDDPQKATLLNNQAVASRLLGPPLLLHLVMTHQAWGDHVEDLAHDLSSQMHRYALAACVNCDLPHTWYTHIVLSFHRLDGVKLEAPQDRLKHRNSYKSRSMNAMRICIDMLKALGCSLTQPMVLVAHADRRHIHVHAVVILPVKDGTQWDVLNFSRNFLYEIALINKKTFELTQPSKRMLARNVKIKKLWEDLVALDT